MKYYLSSYKFGNALDELRKLIPQNRKIGHINNSRDWQGADPKRAKKNQNEEIAFLNEVGFQAEVLDLKDYFGKEDELREKLKSLGGLWVSGGNTFVLRMAMRLSGFDKIFKELQKREDFLYGAYSAGICVLSESLRSLEIVDDPENFPFQGIKEAIYEGLGVFDYALLPHYDSKHPESAAIDKEIQNCIEKKWLFKALRDGEVIIIK